MNKPTPQPVASTQEQAPGRWRRRAGIAAVVLALLALAWWLFAPQPLPVETARVAEGPLAVSVDNMGHIRAHDRYVVDAPVAANLRRIALRDGDPVRRGQVLAWLAPVPLDVRQADQARAGVAAAQALAREAAMQAQRARADLSLAQGERRRMAELSDGGFTSVEALDRAQAAERMARAALEAARFRERAAQAELAAARAALQGAGSRSPAAPIAVRSPADGYVLRVLEQGGRTVAAGTPLLTVGDRARYEVVVDVLSTDAVKIRPGNLMLLEGWGGARVLRARVRQVEPSAFTKISALGVEEQRVNVIGDPIDALGPLGDGYRVEARIVTWSAPRVVKAPSSSLYRAGEGWRVFVVDGKRARERAVTVGQRNQDEAQVLSGLRPGELVVRYPGNELADGSRVTPVAAR